MRLLWSPRPLGREGARSSWLETSSRVLPAIQTYFSHFHAIGRVPEVSATQNVQSQAARMSDAGARDLGASGMDSRNWNQGPTYILIAWKWLKYV